LHQDGVLVIYKGSRVLPKEPKKPRAKVYTSRSRKILDIATFSAAIIGIIVVIALMVVVVEIGLVLLAASSSR
jgi:archaellum biogenesis protein FlaJ (TadC family)